jgi:hypothetical protein
MMGFQIPTFEPNLFSFVKADRNKFLFGNSEGFLGLVSSFVNLS